MTLDISSPRIRSLLRQAEQVASVGKRAAAEKLYRQLVEEAPDLPQAWTGLAGVVREPSSQQAYYQRALELDPENRDALDGISRIRKGTDDPRPLSSVERPANDERVRESDDERLPSGDQELTRSPVHPFTLSPPHDEVVCYRHPKRPTSLRCISCGQPICSRCARRTPVGYRCPNCIREAEEIYFTATVLDHVLAMMVAIPLSLLAGTFVVFWLRGAFFFIFLMLFIGGAVGGLIGRLAHRAAGRRRGRYLPYLVAGAVIMGVLLPTLLGLLAGMLSLGSLLLPGIYLFVATSAAYYAMR